MIIAAFGAVFGLGAAAGGWLGYILGVDYGRFVQRLDWLRRQP